MAPAPEGRPFGPYDLLDELGRGTAGIVYRAFHRSLRRECAIKVLNADLARGRPALRFLREGQAAAKLGRHPNLVQVFDAGMIDGTPFIAMELVKGEPLDRRVRRAGPLPEPELLELGRKLALTLDHAHRCGIVHRDIKPANIMLREDGEPVILDFGIAKDLGSAAQISLDGNVIGTPAFMAPEQADPERGRVDRRTDVYALGATLYYAATDELPYGGATVHEIIYKLLTADLDGLALAGRVTRGLEAVVLRAMEKLPESRYGTALELADDLSRLIEGEPTRVGPLSTWGRLLRRTRRHAEALSLAALALLAVAGGAAYFGFRRAEVAALREELTREIAQGTAEEVRALLEPAEPTLEELRLLAERGLIPIADPDELAEHFAVRFRFRTRFDWLTYGDESGRFTGAERRADGAVLLNRSWVSSQGGRLREELVLPDGARKPLRRSDQWTYDPRERPFYKLAREGTGPVWTPPYPWFDGDGWGISLALPYRGADGALRGVFTADYALTALSTRIAARRVGRSGRAWLLDETGTPIAGPGITGPSSPRDPALTAALAAAPTGVTSLSPGGSSSFSFVFEGRPYAVALASFQAAAGLELETVVLAPADEFEGGVVEDAARLARYVLGGVVAGAALLIALGIRRRRRLFTIATSRRRSLSDSREGSMTEPEDRADPAAADTPRRPEMPAPGVGSAHDTIRDEPPGTGPTPAP